MTLLAGLAYCVTAPCVGGKIILLTFCDDVLDGDGELLDGDDNAFGVNGGKNCFLGRAQDESPTVTIIAAHTHNKNIFFICFLLNLL
jgi:hypothetical protein